MANIVKRNGNENQLEAWDPFRAIREMMRWDPFREMAPMLAPVEREWMPAFEVREDKTGYYFKADLPGVKREDIEVSLTGNRLSIAGKRESEKETKEDTYYAFERSYGSFKRAFTLPEGVDTEHVTTELKDGVLTLAIPKKAEAQAKKIPIAGPAPKS
ncbi:MAG TPA: Hsp20/alpha crystallin family protein [Kofleriaceae bacterium]|nr:Hsp20/alpha crystallin family protein [Kofleriaceae bacterium]